MYAELLTLVFDVLVLSMGIRTPGMVGIYAEAKINALFLKAFASWPAWRIHCDLIGIEVSMLVITTTGVSVLLCSSTTAMLTSQFRGPHDVRRDWLEYARRSSALRGTRTSSVACWRSNGACAAITTSVAFCYTSPCNLVCKVVGTVRRASLISVQQVRRRLMTADWKLDVRGPIDLGDGSPPFPSFDCL